MDRTYRLSEHLITYVRDDTIFKMHGKERAKMTFLENIKAIPVTDIAERLGFQLVKVGKYYSLKEHDSVRIDIEKNCFWRNSRFSQGFKGAAGSSIDFVMEFGGEPDHKKAMRRLALMYGVEGEKPPAMPYKTPEPKREIPGAQPLKKQPGNLCLPLAVGRNNEVYTYLLGRGIAHSVIRYFFGRRMLYQDSKANCVFVSPDNQFACVRGTNDEKRFIADCDGCNYDACFFFKGGKADARRLYVTEAVIDIMSIMTDLVIQEQNYRDNMYLALAGTNKIHSLFYHLARETSIREVWLCYDNDHAGRLADKISIEGMKKMNFRGVWYIHKSPIGNDWNDYAKSLL